MLVFALVVGTLLAVGSQSANKSLLQKFSAAHVVMAMYVGCLVFAFGGALVTQHALSFSIIVLVMGFVNAAILAQLFNRAMQISLSKTMLVLPLTSVVAVVLSAIFLGEWQLLNPLTTVGFINFVGTGITIAGALLLNHKQEHKDRSHHTPAWLVPVIAFVVINGLISFLIKVVADQAVLTSTYILSWYLGAFIGAIPPYLMHVARKKVRMQSIFANTNSALLIVGSSIGVVGSMLVNFLVLRHYAASIFFPLQTFANLAGGVLVGLFVFKEYKNLHSNEKVGMMIGAIGALLLLFNN